MENHLHRRLVPQKELLGIDQIKQIAILVNKSVSLASALCTTLSSPQGISLVVFGLIWTPMPGGLGTARTLSSGQWQVVGLVGVIK